MRGVLMRPSSAQAVEVCDLEALRRAWAGVSFFTGLRTSRHQSMAVDFATLQAQAISS
jgi:hypothetical protein